MNKHRFIIFILVTLLFVGRTSGQIIDKLLQVKYQPGFVILNKGDTLNGAFEFNDCEQNYRLLVYIDPVSRKKRAFEPKEVRFFKLDSLYYVPKELKEGWFFVRILSYDHLKVYLRKHFYTTVIGSRTEDQIMYEKPNGDYLLISMDDFFPFKKRVGDFFRDDTDLYQKIKRGVYTKNNALRIADEYNDWLTNHPQ